KAAEKKIEQAQQNLLRVGDVVTEQEKQLQSLRKQAAKAERYKQMRAEVRDIELWSYSQRWLGLLAQEQVFSQALADKDTERDRAQAELASSEGSLSAARLTLAEEEARVQTLQEELYALDNQVKLGEAENAH